MLPFQYQNPTRIAFGKGQIAKLSKLVPESARVLVTYGGGSIMKNGVYDQVMNALEGFQVDEFSGIEPNPDFDTLVKAADKVKSNNIDFLLAVGGGSVIDGTKFIAAAARSEADPWDLITKRLPVTQAVPLGSVLTLPATGSEMNGGAVVSRRSTGDKLPFIHPVLYPQFSILDPETTFSLPARQTANGVVDAFVHTMEQYLTYPTNAPLQDRFSESLLRTLVEEGPKVMVNPDDYDARANVMWCATLGLNGLIGCGVPQDWATHMIGHEITALHGLDHGQTLAVVLPAMMSVRREQKREKLIQFAKNIWNTDSRDEDDLINTAIARTRAFFEGLGVKTYLSEYGIGEKDIPAIVENLKKHQMVRLGERMDVTPEISQKILEAAL